MYNLFHRRTSDSLLFFDRIERITAVMPTFCSQPTQQQLIAQTKPLGQEGTDQCGERTKTGIVRRMPAMRSVIDRESSQYAANYAAMRSAVERLRSELRRSTEGGGGK